MALLAAEEYNLIIDEAKVALAFLKSNDFENFSKRIEDAWCLFPEPRSNWNQTYNFSKMVFNHCLSHSKIDLAKSWLDRMVSQNNKLHLFDGDIDFNIGKYNFELGEYQQALKIWKSVEKDAGMRYFEREKPEYIDFYLHPEKYMDSQ